MTARLGSARPMLARLIATNEPRCRWPRQRPSGTAIASAIAMAAPGQNHVLQSLLEQQPALVDDELESTAEDAERGDHAGLLRVRPRSEHALHKDEEHVDEERKQDGKRAGGDELGLEPLLSKRGEDRPAEPLGDDKGGDRRERDRRDRGDAKAGDDGG